MTHKCGSSQLITCPLCGQVSTVSSGGLKRIKNNYFIRDLLEQTPKINLESKRRAIECTTYYIKFSESPIFCPFHDRDVIDQYCVDCGLAACGTCLLRDHSHHKRVDLEEQTKISKNQMQAVLLKTDVIIKLIDKQTNESRKYDEQSTIDIKNIKRQIDNVIANGIIPKTEDQMTKLKHQRQILNHLDTIKKRKEEVIKTVRDGLETTKDDMTSLRSYTSILLHHGRAYDLVQQAEDIHSVLMSISKTRVPSFIWRRHDITPPQNDDISVKITKILSFVWSRDDKAASPTDKMTVDNVTVKTDVIDTMSCPVRGSGDVRDNVVSWIPMIAGAPTVTGMVVMDETLWVVCYKESYLHGYPIKRLADPVTSTQQPQNLPIRGLSDPYNMVRFPPGQPQLVISDCDKKQLLLIHVRDGAWKLTIATLKVGYQPCGLGVHDNQLLVCDRNVIHVLSTSGEETHRVNMPQGVTPYKAVAQLTSPGFVVMDCDNPQVVLMSTKGDIQQTYRGEWMFEPNDIVCHDNSIYVTDSYNERVDELSNDGQLIRVQRLAGGQLGLWEVGRMSADNTGCLYVAQGGWGKKQKVWVKEPSILIQLTTMNLSVTWCNYISVDERDKNTSTTDQHEPQSHLRY